MIILGTNSIKDTGYDVDNSARFEANTYMTKTASSGNTKTFTISFWTKRSALGAVASGSNQFPISFYQNGDNRISFAFLTDNTFIVYAAVGGADKMNFTTNRVFRDTSAWYHVVIKVDTTQGTEANRFKMYINGVQETSFSTATYPSQNDDLTINTNIYVGVYDTSNNFFHGYLSEFVYIDGTAYDQTSFGEFDEDSGIWKPIDVSGLTFGTNGFYLDFEDSGNLGNDANGGTDLTEYNFTAIDQSTDTCTNNFATLNPLYPVTTFSYSEGNLKGSSSGSAKGTARGTIGIQDSGKWYFEVKITSSDGSGVGISAEDMNANTWQPSSGTFVIYTSDGNKVVNGTGSSYGATFGDGNIIGVAYNSDDAEITFYKDGASQGTITGVTTGKIMFPSISDTSTSGDPIFEFNFGSPSFAISSGNTDGNGYGNFEYAVPSGYYSLNTKNLAEYG